MKRLSAQIGITYFSALAVAFYLSEKLTFILLIAAVAASVILLCVPKTRKTKCIPAIAVTVAAACIVNIGYSMIAVIPIQEKCSGADRMVTATLTDEVYRSYAKYYYRLRTDTVNGEPVNAKLLLKTSRPIDIEPYDTVSFTADITATENNYYLSKGYYICVDTITDEFAVTPATTYPPYYYAIELRSAMRDALGEYLPEDELSLCEAVLVGDKYALEPAVKDEFRYAGASYFVVVSGLHFSVICLSLIKLFEKLRLRPWMQAVFPLPFLLLYMAVTGFQTSVVRSGVMMFVYLIGRLLRRINYPHNALAIAAFVASIVFTPYGAGDIGLILSFAATFAIITWAEPIYQYIRIKKPLHRRWQWLNVPLSVLSVSLAANILVFPISIFVFNAFSTVTLVSSLLLYLPIELLLILSLIVCILCFLGPLGYVAAFLSWALYGIAKFILWIVHTLAVLPLSYVFISADYVYVWLAATVILGIIVIALRNRCRFLPYASLISVMILLTLMINHTVYSLNTVEFHVFQCGEGIAAGLDYHGDLYMLGFSAKSKEAYSVLNRLSRHYSGAQLAVCIKKADIKNYSRLDDRQFAISHWLLYDKSDLSQDDPDVMTADADTVYEIGNDTTLRTAVYQKKVLSYLSVNGCTILVIPDKYPYEKIPDTFRHPDIIIVQNAYDGYDQLRCDRLIVSNTADKAPDIAELMGKCSANIDYTDQGDISIDLR